MDKLMLFMLIFVPGFISWKVWQIMMPVNVYKPIDYFLESLSYGCINFVVVSQFYTITNSYGMWLLISVVLSIIFPILVKRFRCGDWAREHLVDPIPKAWDGFFGGERTCFALIHLNNGNLIGGLYVDDSCASTFPNEEDLYLCEVWKINNNGEFLSKIEDTAGLLISRDKMEYIEFFHIKTQD